MNYLLLLPSSPLFHAVDNQVLCRNQICGYHLHPLHNAVHSDWTAPLPNFHLLHHFFKTQLLDRIFLSSLNSMACPFLGTPSTVITPLLA